MNYQRPRLLRPLVTPLVSTLARPGIGGVSGFLLPTFEIDAAKLTSSPSSLPAGAAFTRSSGATRINHAGRLEEMASNTMRISYDRTLTYNYFDDPWFDTFTVGSAPPSWLRFFGGGGPLNSVVQAKGTTTDGLPFVTIRYQSTPTNANPIGLVIGAAVAGQGVPLMVGDTFSGWCRARIDGVSGITSVVRSLRLSEATATFPTAASYTVMVDMPVDGQWYEASATRTANNATVTQGCLYLVIGGGTIGAPVDLTVTVVFPVIHNGATPLSTTPGIPTLAQRVNGVPQYGLRGLTREEAGSNTIANPRAEGSTPGVVGSGGVAPTGWTLNSAVTVVGTGTEYGIPYIDLRIQSAGALGAIAVTFLSAGTVAAPGDIWAISYFTRLIAGSLTTGGVTLQHSVLWRDASVANISFGTTPFVPTNVPLYQALFSDAQTAPALTASAVPRIRLFSSGACDFTIRIGAPQFEKWPHATSRIMPAAGSPATSNRAAELLTIPASAVSMGRGALAIRFAAAMNGISANHTANRAAWSLLGDINNRVSVVYRTTTGPQKEIQVVSGGLAQASLQQAAALPDVFDTLCGTWDAASAILGINGAAPATTGPVTVPAASAAGGSPGYTTAGILGSNNVYRFIRVWKDRKLTAAQVRRESGRAA